MASTYTNSQRVVLEKYVTPWGFVYLFSNRIIDKVLVQYVS